MLSSSVIDQRGRRRQLFGFAQLPWKVRASIGRDDYRRIWRRVWLRLAPVHMLGYVAAYVVSAAAVSGLMRVIPWSSLSMAPVLIVIITWFAVVNVLGYCGGQWLAHRLFRARIADAFLAEGRCPTCVYDLAGAAVAEDGCSVCPECGGAWQMAPAAPAGSE